MRAPLAALSHAFDKAIHSETARQVWAGFKFILVVLPKAYSEKVAVGAAVFVVFLIGIGSVRVTAAIPSEPPVSVKSVLKDQSRLPSMDPALERMIFPPPRPLVCDDCPIIPKAVQTQSIKPDDKKKSQVPKGNAKGKDKSKRSDAESSTEPARIQLASVGDVSIPSTAIEERPTTLSTPFGTKIATKVSLAKMPSELVTFLQKVQAQCGKVTAISGYRTSGVPGTCHARNQAIDYQVKDPTCALKVAKGFRGGHSIDYYGVQALSKDMPAHYHVSVCPREMGARFAHRGSSTRYAKSRGARATLVATRRTPSRSTRVRVAGSSTNPQAHVRGENFR